MQMWCSCFCSLEINKPVLGDFFHRVLSPILAAIFFDAIGKSYKYIAGSRQWVTTLLVS